MSLEAVIRHHEVHGHHKGTPSVLDLVDRGLEVLGEEGAMGEERDCALHCVYASSLLGH